MPDSPLTPQVQPQVAQVVHQFHQRLGLLRVQLIQDEGPLRRRVAGHGPDNVLGKVPLIPGRRHRRRDHHSQGHDLAKLLRHKFARGSAAVVVRQRFLDLPGQRFRIPLRGRRSPRLLGGLIAGTPPPGQVTRAAHAMRDPDGLQALAVRQYHLGTRRYRLRTQASPDNALQDRPLICRKNDRLRIRACRDHRFPFSSVIPEVSASDGVRSGAATAGQDDRDPQGQQRQRRRLWHDRHAELTVVVQHAQAV